MNRFAAYLLVLAIGAFASSAAADDIVCDLLTVGDAPDGPGTITSVPVPDISKLIIQVRTTRTLTEQVAGVTTPLTHKCAIASDLTEVDVMMNEAGFAGYVPVVNPTNAPLFDQAFIKHIDDSVEADLVRELAYAILHPNGNADEAMAKVKSNSNLYNPNVMNVYYVHYPAVNMSANNTDVPFEVKGMHIRNEEGNSEKMIFYGDSATPSTLAHEFAHAFSAGHVNFWDRDGVEWCVKYLPYNITSELTAAQIESIDMICEFSRQNYMWAGSLEDRQELGTPQKERMKHNEHSVISEFSPSSSQINCPDFRSNPNEDCSRLAGP